MINLIPTTEKKNMIRDFYFRFATVLAGALVCVLVVASASLLPSYFTISAKQSAFEAGVKNLQNKSLSDRDIQTLAVVGDVNSKLKILEDAQRQEFLVTNNIINSILIRTTPDIKIKQIQYEYVEPAGGKVKLSGSASSRESLLAFRLALENNPSFTEIDLPISNFVRGTNIQFFLSLNVK